MAIEKSIYQAPQGLQSIAPEDDLEIVLADEEEGETKPEKEEDNEFDKNLAEDMDEGAMSALASELIGLYDADLIDRKEWFETYQKGMELLGLKYENRTEPWPGACGVFHPLLMESAVKFQAETITETFPAAGPVRTKIIG